MIAQLLNPTPKTATCVFCGRSFTPMVFVSACCSDECVDGEKAKRGLDALGNPLKARSKASATGWNALCPPRYAAFDPAKLPERGRAVCEQVLGFDLNTNPARGLALVGPSDCGKSMLIHEAGRRAYAAGFGVLVTSATEFAFKCGSPDNDERRAYIKACCDIPVLLLDDVGKWKLTETTEANVYHVLEQRERYERATFWTANAKGQQLLDTMTDDRAEPIVNRLRRSALVVGV